MHHATIVGYVNKNIALPICYTQFISVTEFIQQKTMPMGV